MELKFVTREELEVVGCVLHLLLCVAIIFVLAFTNVWVVVVIVGLLLMCVDTLEIEIAKSPTRLYGEGVIEA
ncbi:hypothetical protein VPHD148_0025 [Vibrio phage D148]